MKYIKTFENNIFHFGKDYMTKEINLLYDDINILKKNYIPYDLYYYNDNIFGTCFKLYNFTSLAKNEEKILKNHKFSVFKGYYEFTWNWQKIKEEDIPLLIQTTKYNL